MCYKKVGFKCSIIIDKVHLVRINKLALSGYKCISNGKYGLAGKFCETLIHKQKSVKI